VEQTLPEVRSHAEQIDQLVPTINKSKEASGPRRCRRRVFVEPDVTLPDLDLPDRQHAITEYVQAPIGYIKQEDIARARGLSKTTAI